MQTCAYQLKKKIVTKGDLYQNLVFPQVRKFMYNALHEPRIVICSRLSNTALDSKGMGIDINGYVFLMSECSRLRRKLLENFLQDIFCLA